MFSRLKQGFRCLFLKFNKNQELEVKSILSLDEFKIFNEMNDYDKLHSFLIYKCVMKNKTLKNDRLYLKLALLHDSGKGNVTFFRRIKKVLIGDEKLEKHPQNAFEKLKKIDIELAKLCRDHHKKDVESKMKLFQDIDDE
ncbi:MAG: HD domain-containing protein [Cetobacterium sp.]